MFTDLKEFVEMRREIHQRPELGFEEHRTADLIAEKLTQWGIPFHRGLGKTGIVGVIRGSSAAAGENTHVGALPEQGDRAIGLRADMDALPIMELNTFAHRSQSAGKMHACGHDGHVTMLLAAAKELAHSRRFAGTVYLIFQPAEEGGGGAREMIKDGLFERFPMEAVFGLHNWPGIAAGKFAINGGPAFASASKFKVLIHGKGAHGAMPHNGIDPVPVACQMVQAFQMIITRNKRPIDTAVISVTMIHAGEATNVVPDTCEIQGTVRTFTLDVLDLIERRMRQIAEATCHAFDARCEFEFERYYPPTINHRVETEHLRNILRDVVGNENVLEFEPTMASEDFSFFLQVKAGCYFVIGNGDSQIGDGADGAPPPMLHNPRYDFNDSIIPVGSSTWVRIVEKWFQV